MAICDVVGAIAAGLMGVASFLPGEPTLPWWKAIVVPAFLVGLPSFAVFVFEVATSPNKPVRKQSLVTTFPGWRGLAAAATIAAAFVFAFSHSGAANPEQHGDKYYDNQHGELIEISEREALDGMVGQSRLFAGLALAFNALPALYFTRPDRNTRR